MSELQVHSAGTTAKSGRGSDASAPDTVTKSLPIPPAGETWARLLANPATNNQEASLAMMQLTLQVN